MSSAGPLQFDTRDTRLQAELRERVDTWFSEQGRSKHADWRMIAKTVGFLGAWAGLLALLTSGALPALGALPVALGLGAVLAGVGFNVCHDAIHGAYSRRAWVNRALAHTFDLMGASSYTWARAHNFVHHTYTNVPGLDHDLEPGGWLLFYPREKPAFIYRYQHLFAPLLYCFTTLVWVFKKDLEQLFAADPRTGRRAPGRVVAAVLGWKAVHLTLFLGLPLALSGYAWWQVVVGYGVMHAALGLTSAVVFSLAHLVEAPAFPEAAAVKHSWAAHQLFTTANFAPNSRLAAFLFGGLNRQVEHHLLPKICHVHYPALASIVRAVAREHGLPYHQSPSFAHALRSHLRTLRRCGRPLAERERRELSETATAPA